MKSRRLPSSLGATSALLSLAALGLLAACSAPAVSSAGPDPTAFVLTRVAEIITQDAASQTPPPTPEATPLPASPAFTPVTSQPATAGATVTPLPSPALSPTPPTPCASAECISSAAHFWLERPVPAEYTIHPDRTYPYGSTAEGVREPHHGVEFQNTSGTPVIAAAPGTVVAAGDDTVTAYGPATHFYGLLVVVQLDQAYQGQPVYTLYGHLSQAIARVGQHVEAGDLLGLVGQTGVAIGPHLHFEVRVGNDNYFSTRNPELWLKPLWFDSQPGGAIAGRVADLDGNPVPELTVVIRPEQVAAENVRTRYLTTYARESLNGDDLLQENFATGDLPPGTYTVSVNTTTLYRQAIELRPGQVAWIEFTVKPPAPATAATPPPAPAP